MMAYTPAEMEWIRHGPYILLLLFRLHRHSPCYYRLSPHSNEVRLKVELPGLIL